MKFFIIGLAAVVAVFIAMAMWLPDIMDWLDPGKPEDDEDAEKFNFATRNMRRDPEYAPYCGRCSGLVRMARISPTVARCRCGAVHDTEMDDDGKD